MARKKDLTGAINRGADLFFSANDVEAQEEQQAHEAQQPQEAQEARNRPLEGRSGPLEATEPGAEEHIEALETRRTQGRRGLKMPRMNMAFTPSNMEYLKTMAGVHGMTVTRFMNHVIEQHAEANATRYQKAREIMRDE